MERKILLTDTADEPGLIYKITEVCFLHGLNIIKNQEYVATDERRFFMRTYLEETLTIVSCLKSGESSARRLM